MADAKIDTKHVNDSIVYLTYMADRLLDRRVAPVAKSFSKEFLTRVKDVLEKHDLDSIRDLDYYSELKEGIKSEASFKH